jgi:diaminopimelate epimerase
MTAFSKMHGLGNDFVVINLLKTKTELTATFIATLSNRHTGIGFDQLLVIEASEKADFFCRIYNSDGSEAEQCGNGLRCVARYLHEERVISKKQFAIETKAGIFAIEIKDYDHIRVCMGTPLFRDEQLSSEELFDDELLSFRALFSEEPPNKTSDLPQDTSISILSMGNPHAILKVASLENLAIENIASKISSQDIFPDGVNVGFMQIVSKHHIRLRTFERGAGETLACGSNACASAASGIQQGSLQSPVKVELAYGSLEIDWQGEGQPLYMTGPAAKIFTGVI